MKTLTRKQSRILNYATSQLFSSKAITAPTPAEFRSSSNLLSRLLQLPDHRTLLLTDAGLAHMRSIVATLHDADFYQGQANYSDIWTALKNSYVRLLSREQELSSTNELLETLHQFLHDEIKNHTFVVPLFGIELTGVDCISLGSMKLVKPAVSHLDTIGVKHDHTDLGPIFSIHEHCLWLVGTKTGTLDVALEKFRMHADLVCGMLSICAASMYELGATGFRIGTIMSPEQGHSSAVWLSWDHKNMSAVVHRKFVGSQNFPVDNDFVEQLRTSIVLQKAFDLIDSDKRTPLEETILKGIYWYADAQRDQAHVMKLIKYWSCVEAFFSTENKDITRSVSTGLACALVFGGYGFFPETEYASLKKRITQLYKLRSRAVHRATHQHVSYLDTSELSKMVAQMLIVMVSLAQQGHADVEKIKNSTTRIDERLSANQPQ